MKNLVFILVLLSAPGVLRAQTPPTPKSTSTAARRKITVRTSYHGFALGFASWQDKITLQNATGTTYDMKAQVYSSTFAYEYLKYQTTWGYKASLGALLGALDIQEDNSDLTYYKKGVSVLGAFLEPGIFWLPENFSRVQVGLSLPLTYRHANLSAPSSDVTYKTNDNFLIGLGLDLGWRFYKNWYIQQRISNGIGYRESMWSISLAWLGL